MADSNAFRADMRPEFDDTDPFAELTRIMGHDPRQHEALLLPAREDLAPGMPLVQLVVQRPDERPEPGLAKNRGIRGMIVDGVEVKRDGFSEERLLADMVCDGCHGEMLEGEIGRMHQRTGQLFCARCASRVQSVAPPPA